MNGKKTKHVRVGAAVHRDLLKLARLERRDIAEVTDRLLAAALPAAIQAAEAALRAAPETPP